MLLLAEQGWVIVTTGNITHNLRDWQMASGGLTISTSHARRSSTGARSIIPMPCSPGSTMSIC